MSRKKPLPLEGDRTTSLFRLLRLSAGVLVKVSQSVVVKSEFSCNTKLVEGTIQEKARPLLEDARFNWGVGTDCETQTPPTYGGGYWL